MKYYFQSNKVKRESVYVLCREGNWGQSFKDSNVNSNQIEDLLQEKLN